MNEKRKIIYSIHVMEELVARGHVPVATMPNPKKPEFLCWIFEVSPELQEDLDLVLGGKYHG